MRDVNGFPKDLLDKTIEERYKYFSNFTIDHPKLNKTTREVIKRIKNPGGFSLFILIGPSGVGKTTLKRRVEKKIIEELIDEIELDKGRIPIAGIEIISPDSGSFNWKDYYKRCLEALKEPLIEYKIDYDKLINKDKERLKVSYGKTAPELRKSLENTFFYRNPAAFIIDEAQHFTKMTSGRRLQDQLDTIKSLANITDIVHVLIGTYELLPFVNLSAQLSRRTIDIHFPRYQANKEDMNAFTGIINTFQKYLPLEEEPDLVSHWEFIYERTIGCVGILKNWLETCLSDALNKNLKTIDYKLLQKNALSINKVGKMAIEATRGESNFEYDEGKRKKLRSILGLDILKVNENDNKKKETTKKRKVGQRNPCRDKVGMI